MWATRSLAAAQGTLRERRPRRTQFDLLMTHVAQHRLYRPRRCLSAESTQPYCLISQDLTPSLQSVIVLDIIPALLRCGLIWVRQRLVNVSNVCPSPPSQKAPTVFTVSNPAFMKGITRPRHEAGQGVGYLFTQMCIPHICDALRYGVSVDHAARSQNKGKSMRRLSIEITPEQHQRLKAIAALSGKTIKEYVLERVLPPPPERESLSEEEALHQLEAFLKPRIEAAERGEVVTQTVAEIISELKQERHAREV